ncbi:MULTISPECIES: cell division protein FtsL [Enterococcaceae]|uniref:cell division protein FtsL n=1 Tax=Enterococcaceae TaxID=81852 RepID=UPI000E4E489B|nr:MULTISPECIES: cell division protein FtsL [Enterococcaceae]MCI0130480.1 cell division protein FtsL [Vagococcus sp. CY53-2]RGI32207.1 cell division protein FtsL [Melissococcus sp. OM08-11BH]UNM89913.1 cell division protein FtsL [Vagococcus sp. CY52-2]
MSLPEKQSPFTYNDSPVNSPVSKENSTLEEVQPPIIPQSKLKKVTKLEKFIFTVFIATFLCLAVATIRMTTYINREEEAISSLQADSKQMQQDIETLDQEKNELQRTERLKKIAESAGMQMRDENIRKIK